MSDLRFPDSYLLFMWLALDGFDGKECAACFYTAFDVCLGDISITNVHPLEGLTRGWLMI